MHSDCDDVEAPLSEGQAQWHADQGVGQAHRSGCIRVCGDLQDVERCGFYCRLELLPWIV